MNNEIIQELEKIANKNGGILQPEKVVEEARNSRSPLHSRFTWDDSKAASEYRLEQARRLIRVVVNVMPNGGTEPERIWVSLRQDQQEEGGGYRTLVSVLSDKQLRQQLLEEALSDMEYFEQKYSHLKELAEVFSAIKNMKKK